MTATRDTKQIGTRIPLELYEWLRLRAFQERTSINALVLEAIELLRRRRDPESKELRL